LHDNEISFDASDLLSSKLVVQTYLQTLVEHHDGLVELFLLSRLVTIISFIDRRSLTMFVMIRESNKLC
jgi:hypothetical protein